jgi:hypothetical protein
MFKKKLIRVQKDVQILLKCSNRTKDFGLNRFRFKKNLCGQKSTYIN